VPFVSIKFVKENIAGDPKAKMARIAERISDVIVDEMGATKQNVWVVFEGIPATEFHVGGESVADIKARKS